MCLRPFTEVDDPLRCLESKLELEHLYLVAIIGSLAVLSYHNLFKNSRMQHLSFCNTLKWGATSLLKWLKSIFSASILVPEGHNCAVWKAHSTFWKAQRSYLYEMPGNLPEFWKIFCVCVFEKVRWNRTKKFFPLKSTRNANIWMFSGCSWRDDPEHFM